MHSKFIKKIDSNRSSNQSGFTLIELLMVVAVILILSSITYGIVTGVQSSQARARVKADLVLISAALEQFKAVHGDYPWITGATASSDANAESLFQALDGWMKWQRNGAGEVERLTGRSDSEGQGKSFIDPMKFSLNGEYSVDDKPTDIYIQDPWGQAYAYRYGGNFIRSWDNVGYVLYSIGPDGEDLAVSSSGIVTKAIREAANNRDNIYVGE